ncbi:MAG TPA: hypothetical protein VEI73_10465 [Candidatus Acidoferrum sp.]|nr:hypothetical protein [Candidatus Acidoferrum sp.]
MEWIRRAFRVPASESHVGFVLAISLFIMSAMSVALIWQAQIIADQREAIRWLEHMKLGS